MCQAIAINGGLQSARSLVKVDLEAAQAEEREQLLAEPLNLRDVIDRVIG